MSTAQQPPTFTTSPKPEGEAGAPWHRRHHRAVFIGAIVAAFVVGVGAGGAGPQEELDRTKAELADQRSAAQTASSTADQRVADADAKIAAADSRARADARAELADERATLRSDTTSLNRRKAELDRRERKVAGLEAQATRNSFDGTGTYLVGADIKPGTYRAPATPGCYWARLSSLSGMDIAANDNADGPVVVEISPSDKAFEAKDCGRFTRIGG